MNMSINCPSCTHAIAFDDVGRLPPWCSACGATLSRASTPTPSTEAVPATAVSSRTAAAPVVVTVPQSPPAGPRPLTYFYACVPKVLQHERLNAIRFYVTASDLIAFPAGMGSIRGEQYVPQNRVSSVIGGIGHGAMMMNAGRIDCELRNLHDAQGLVGLEGASEAAVLEAALNTSGAVIIPGGELRQVRIESPGIWFTLTRGIKCAATLRLNYSNFGTLALPSLTDARRAVEGLTALLGNALHVNLPWGSRRS